MCAKPCRSQIKLIIIYTTPWLEDSKTCRPASVGSNLDTCSQQMDNGLSSWDSVTVWVPMCRTECTYLFAGHSAQQQYNCRRSQPSPPLLLLLPRATADFGKPSLWWHLPVRDDTMQHDKELSYSIQLRHLYQTEGNTGSAVCFKNHFICFMSSGLCGFRTG